MLIGLAQCNMMFISVSLCNMSVAINYKTVKFTPINSLQFVAYVLSVRLFIFLKTVQCFKLRSSGL